MVCRHSADDPNCSSHRNYIVDPYKYPSSLSSETPETPDSSKYTIEDAKRIGAHLVLKVKYPNCFNCSYEGNKIMVFLNVTEIDVLKWKKIDPHFRDPKRKAVNEAPSPAARFPGSPEGWSDALAYAQGKC